MEEIIAYVAIGMCYITVLNLLESLASLRLMQFCKL